MSDKQSSKVAEFEIVPERSNTPSKRSESTLPSTSPTSEIWVAGKPEASSARTPPKSGVVPSVVARLCAAAQPVSPDTKSLLTSRTWRPASAGSVKARLSVEPETKADSSAADEPSKLSWMVGGCGGGDGGGGDGGGDGGGGLGGGGVGGGGEGGGGEGGGGEGGGGEGEVRTKMRIAG